MDETLFRPKYKLGCYTILNKIGEGGMGTVYLVHPPREDRQLVAKVIKTKGEVQLKRFLREAEASLALNHPNIVKTHGLFYEKKFPISLWITSQGRSLSNTSNKAHC